MTITAEELKAQRDNAEQGEFMADGCSLDIDTSEGGLAECAVFVFPETASYAASVMQAHITGQLVHVDEVEKLRVKPLEWVEDESWRHRGMPPVNLGGFCLNVMQRGDWSWRVAGQSGSHETLEAAKSAAQVLFERRVLSMLANKRAALGDSHD